MPQLKKIASSTLAMLVVAALPSGYACAVDKPAAAPAEQVKQSAAEQVKESAPQQAKDSAAQQGKDLAAQQVKQSPDDVLVKINGKAIVRKEVERSLRVALSQNRGGQIPTSQLQKAEESVLEQLVNSELLYQAAQEAEIKALEKEVEQQIAENRRRFPTEAQYQAALVGMQMTPKEVEAFTRRDIAINRLIEKRLGDKGQVSEEEARKFYEDNRARYFEKGEMARASHILIPVKEGATVEEKKQAREKAQAAQKRAKAGEDFAALAKAESGCPSAAKGGELGQFGKGEMVAPFEKAAFALKPGELSEVVETQFGYHVIKVTERIPARTESFEEARDRIVEYIKRQKISAALPNFLKELKDKAKIEKG